MRITNLDVQNFRGIKKCSIAFPLNTRLVCLIGAGDSTKSTLLKAIEWILWPAWNLQATDMDFSDGDTKTPITFRGTFTELPESLLSEDKFGLYLRRPNIPVSPDIDDEPRDDCPHCLTLQLTISETLEPQWEVVCNRLEPKPISLADRRTLSCGSIGDNYSRDMYWGRQSVLQRYSDAKDPLRGVYMNALRGVAKDADFSSLDKVSETIIEVGKEYGVSFSTNVRNGFIIQNAYSSTSTPVGLFDGNVPLGQRGTGSQRLLSMGLNIGASDNGSILLIDEIENGLEPYRLCSVINELRLKQKDSGQTIMTTHSSVTVEECTIEELLIVRSEHGETKAYSLKGNDRKTNEAMQAEVRRNAKAFLCKRIIVCEGNTEIGFIRAFDTYLSEFEKIRLAYKGIGTADGKGSSIFDCARRLLKCGYDVCLFMDNDRADEKPHKEALRAEGVSVFDWDEPNAIEEQVFADVPSVLAEELVNVALREHGMRVYHTLITQGIPCEMIGEYVRLLAMEHEVQRSIGSIAKENQDGKNKKSEKKGEWFKRISLGEAMGSVVFNNLDMIDTTRTLCRVMGNLYRWVIRND